MSSLLDIGPWSVPALTFSAGVCDLLGGGVPGGAADVAGP